MRKSESGTNRRGGGKGRGRGGRGGGRGSAPTASSSANAPSFVSGETAKNDKSKRKVTGPTSSTRTVSTSGNATRPTRAVNTVMRKMVVRHIPYSATEDGVWSLLEKHGVGKEFAWRFVPGKVRGNNRQPTMARMYLDFKKDPELAKTLIAGLNGRTFDDSNDGQQPLEVEFALYQKIPREKTRKDAKMGTIDRDPEYLAFLEELAKPKEKLPSAEAMADSVEGETVEKPIATLVKYLNEKKAHSRDKGKGKVGNKTFEKGSSARRQSRKKEKTGKEKTKSKSNDRQKTADATSSQEPTKSRGSRAKNTPSKTEAASTEQLQPGMVRIMAPKFSSFATTAEPVVEANTPEKASQPTDKKGKKGASSGGRARGKPRGGNDRALNGGKATELNEGDHGESKNRSRKDLNRRKKDATGKGDRNKKVYAPKEQPSQGSLFKG